MLGNDTERNNVIAYATFIRHAYRSRWAAAYRQRHAIGLRLLHELRRRQDPPHDQDLECGLGAADADELAKRSMLQTEV